jgi:hypothetical protein
MSLSHFSLRLSFSIPIIFVSRLKDEDTLNNQKPSIENEQFRHLMYNFWNEDNFRKKTLDQVCKDFGLSGIILKIDSLEECKTTIQLEELLNRSINPKNIDRLLYIADLDIKVKSNSKSLALTIITRVAFKVFLRTYFDSEYRS